MAQADGEKVALPTKEQFDIIQNRIAMALAKREALVKSWTAKSKTPRGQEKTDAELDEEDTKLFHLEPPYLGVGCPIPADFLISEVEKHEKSLRAVFFSKGALKVAKKKEEEDRAVSPKRKIYEESSDEEEGRSSLGKAKKQKTTASTKQNIRVEEENGTSGIEIIGAGKSHPEESTKKVQNDKMKNGAVASLATPPATPEKLAETTGTTKFIHTGAEQGIAEVADRKPHDQTEVGTTSQKEKQEALSKSDEMTREQKRRAKKKASRKARKAKKENALLESLLTEAGYESSRSFVP